MLFWGHSCSRSLSGKPSRFGKNRRSQFLSFSGRLAVPGSCVTTVGQFPTPCG